MSEKPKKKTDSFEQMWDDTGDGEDYKGRAETLYDEAIKANLPEPFVRAIVGLCRQVNGMDEVYYATFASKEEDITPLERTLRNHKHLPTGEAVEPL